MATPAGATAGASTESEERTLRHQIVVVDLDQPQSPQLVKQLRKGEGQLMTDVEHVVNDLIEAGTLKMNAQPVVIVVREQTSFTVELVEGDRPVVVGVVNAFEALRERVDRHAVINNWVGRFAFRASLETSFAFGGGAGLFGSLAVTLV